MISRDELISLYSTHYKEIFNYIYHLTGSHETAEDILQETFINIIEYSKKNIINHDTVKSLLYRTAHNLSINYLKKNEKTDSLDDDINYLPAASTVDDDLFAKEIHNEVSNALQQLDTVSRSIFIMKRDNNYTNEEIAKLLHISERTVRRKLQSTLSHILLHLKTKGYFEE
ncbi:MAG: RNA polymerase sigma factor [Spirochaetota bacterium]|nr:RNA polymerase sigma factor [Spirochaetota bacterium]